MRLDAHFDMLPERAFLKVGGRITYEGGKGGGGGGQAPATQTVNQTNLPEYAEPYFRRLMDRAEGVSQQAYPTYQGPRLAGLDPNQQSAITQAGGMGANAQQQFNTGAGLTEQAGLRSLQTSTFDPASANRFMSPYLQGALDPVMAQIQRNADMNASNIGADAAQHGALGGYRQGIQLAENQRNADFLKAQTLSQGYQNAYQSALGAAQQQFNTDRAAQLQGNQIAMGAGAQLGQFANQGLGALQSTGALGQQQQQSALDLAYQDFMNTQDFPRQQLNFLSGILRGVPVSPSSNISTFQAPPNQYSQLLGLGIAGAGIGKMMS